MIPEFQIVPRSDGVGRRLLDALILPAWPRREAHWRDVNLAGQHVIIVQAKASRLGMYLMGQATLLSTACTNPLRSGKRPLGDSVFEGRQCVAGILGSVSGGRGGRG